MKMVAFIEVSSSGKVYVNPDQVLYCIANNPNTAEGRGSTNIHFRADYGITVDGAVDHVAKMLAAKQ